MKTMNLGGSLWPPSTLRVFIGKSSFEFTGGGKSPTACKAIVTGDLTSCVHRAFFEKNARMHVSNAVALSRSVNCKLKLGTTRRCASPDLCNRVGKEVHFMSPSFVCWRTLCRLSQETLGLLSPRASAPLAWSPRWLSPQLSMKLPAQLSSVSRAAPNVETPRPSM